MTRRSKAFRYLVGAITTVLLSTLIIYAVKSGFVGAFGNAKFLLVGVGLVFVIASLLGAIIVHRAYQGLLWEHRLVIYIALCLLGLGGIAGLWTGLAPAFLPSDWFGIGICFAAINLFLLLLGPPLCGYILWRKRKHSEG
jgi:hypothetical protein